MLTAIARFVKPTRRAGSQSGQMIVIGAFAFIAMLAVAGLAVDGGRAYVNRRSLQASADSGADAAMRMILQDYRDFAASKTQTFSDCDIALKVADLTSAGQASAASSGIDSYVAVYTNPSGNAPAHGAGGVGSANTTSTPGCAPGSPSAASLNLCTTASETSDPSADCVAGLKSTPQYNQLTYLLRVVGETAATQKATSDSVFRLQHINLGGSAPWLVWHEDCGTGATQGTDKGPIRGESTVNKRDGSIQTFESSTGGWAGSSITCGSGDTSNSASFKGYIGTNTCGKASAALTGTPSNPVGNLCDGTGGLPLGTYDSKNQDGKACAEECAEFTALLQPVVTSNSALGPPSDICTGGGLPSKLPPVACTAMVFPVITTISGGGNSYHFTVTQYVAAIPVDNTHVQVVFVCDPGSTYNNCKVPTNEQSVFSAFLH